MAKKWVLFMVALFVLAMSVVPAFAQTTRTITVTEQQVNSTFRVTNPARRSISNVRVDLQAGQVVVTATLTERNGTTNNLSATLAPSVVNGRVNWTVTAAAANGTPASGDLLTQINNHIAASWTRYAKNKAETGRVQSVTVTDSDIAWVIAGRR